MNINQTTVKELLMSVCTFCYDSPTVISHDVDNLVISFCAICGRNGTVAPAVFRSVPDTPRIRHAVSCLEDMAVLGELCDCPDPRDTVVLCPPCTRVEADGLSIVVDTYSGECDRCGIVSEDLSELVSSSLIPL